MKIPKPRTISEAWRLARAYTRYRWHEHGARVWGVRGSGVGESGAALEILCLEIRMVHMVGELAESWEQTTKIMRSCMEYMESLGRAIEGAMEND